MSRMTTKAASEASPSRNTIPKVHHQPAFPTICLLRPAASMKPIPWSAISGSTYIQITVSQTDTTKAMSAPRNGRRPRMFSPSETPSRTRA